VLARLLVLVLLLFPVVVSLGVTLLVRILVPPPAGGTGRIAWWAALLVLAIALPTSLPLPILTKLPLHLAKLSGDEESDGS
jgi:hypothetical protein